MTQKVVRPIALDESFRTTESTPRNIADVLAENLLAIKEAIENGTDTGGAFIVSYESTTAQQIYDAIRENKVPYLYYNEVVAQLWKVETNKYTFRTTETRVVDSQTYLDIIDYSVTGITWDTDTKTISGGGGGGIVDGGELDLNDYIFLENNKKYSLDNDSLSVLNFVCEKADDEQFNIVVDLTAGTNCQINVFEKNGNFLYSMPFSGTNVISTNGTYKITILNGSYYIEQLSIPSGDPAGVFLDGVFYGLVKINGLLWSTSDLLLNIGDNIYTNESPFGEKRYFRGNSNDLSAALNDYGVRLPTKDEIDDLIAYLGGGNVACAAIRSTTQWYSGRNGNNSSGLSVQPSGYFNYIGGSIFDKGYFGSLLSSGDQGSNIYRFYYNDSIVGYSTSSTNSPVRFVIDT